MAGGLAGGGGGSGCGDIVESSGSDEEIMCIKVVPRTRSKIPDMLARERARHMKDSTWVKRHGISETKIDQVVNRSRVESVSVGLGGAWYLKTPKENHEDEIPGAPGPR